MIIMDIIEQAFAAILAFLLVIIYRICKCILLLNRELKEVNNDNKVVMKYGGSINRNKNNATLNDYFAIALNGRNLDVVAKYKELFVETYDADMLPPVITIDDIKHELPYHEGQSLYRPTIHVGQRKLFLTEVQFLTDWAAPTDNKICIYAGAAPSNHTGYLASLFPNIKFILVDPNPFNIHGARPIAIARDGAMIECDNGMCENLRVWSSDNIDENRKIAKIIVQTIQSNDNINQITIINDLFTLELAKAIGAAIDSDSLLFISDIRTNMVEDDPQDIDILWNLAQQYNWIRAMRPHQSMLKFRYPFYSDATVGEWATRQPYADDFMHAMNNGGIDFIANYNMGKLMYMDGNINIQAFGPRATTETRLITNGIDVIEFAPMRNYENKLFYYNNIERGFGRHNNPNCSRELGFDLCGDCALENHIWSSYIKKYMTNDKEIIKNPTRQIHKFVLDLSNNTRRGLLRDGHGRLFGPMPINIMIRGVEAGANDSKITNQNKIKYANNSRKYNVK